MKFSVIIPLYNKAPYIRKALESVFAQTYTDYELIVVDDGSTDDSACIVQQFIDERLKVKGEETSGAVTSTYNLSPITYKLSVRLITQSNAGVSAARNAGVATSSGDYIAFLDADDWWEPTYLEKMAQLIEDYSEAGLYASNYYYHKDGVNIIKVDIPTGYFNYPKEYFKNFAMPVWTGATMIPRNVYDEMGGFPLGIKLGEDFLLWAKIALRYKVAFLNQPLAYYNNTLPPNYRATYHLHKPEEHMLFRLELAFSNGDEANGTNEECKVDSVKCKGEENGKADTPAFSLSPLASNLKSDWQSLLDMLRLLGLHSYWLSDEYHELAQKEIDKVDMNQQYDFLLKLYRTPRWQQKCKQRILQMASGPIALLKRLKQGKKTTHTKVVITNKEYRKSMGLPD